MAILTQFVKNQVVRVTTNVLCLKHVLIGNVKTLVYTKDADRMPNVQLIDIDQNVLAYLGTEEILTIFVEK